MAAPSWTDNVSVIAAAALARGGLARGTIDLRTKFGASVYVKFGRGGTTALTNGVTVLAYPVLNNDTAVAGGAHPAGFQFQGSYSAAAATTVNSDTSAGARDLNVASVTGFAVGDFICVQDSGGGVTRLEFNRVAVTATGILTLTRPLQFAHTAAQADTVRSGADVFSPMWLSGGTLWEVMVDYEDDAAGEDGVVVVLAQTCDSVA